MTTLNNYCLKLEASPCPQVKLKLFGGEESENQYQLQLECIYDSAKELKQKFSEIENKTMDFFSSQQKYPLLK